MKEKGIKSLLLGSFIASLLASACCIGPIFFALLGISSIGLLSSFEPYRNILSVIALLALSLGLALSFRRKPPLECKEGSLCANPKSDALNRSILFIAALVVLAVLTFPQWSLFFV